MEYNTHTLSNGIRLIHKKTESTVAHCGVIINTGSRDEDEDEHGLAHLIEHIIFKGTKKRKAYHILSRMEDIGGEINAYTTKEETAIFTTFFDTYYSRALELLSDILFNSVFPDKEIEKEKEVIIDEINSYKDSPIELIYDDFEDQIYRGNSIGRNILGEERTLKDFSREKILNFYRKNYCTDQMVVASVGNISFPKLVRYFEKYFNAIPEKLSTRNRSLMNGYVPLKKEVKKDTYQTHCILGNIAYNLKDKRRLALHLLNNLLGGPGLNSRLNLALREKNGIAYNIDSSYTAYSDTGIISIYFGADKIDMNRATRLVLHELNKLKSTPMGTLQLQKAKRQLLGQIAISSENNENLMLTIGKSYLIFDKVDSFREIEEKVDAITPVQLCEIANDIFDESKLSYLIFK